MTIFNHVFTIFLFSLFFIGCSNPDNHNSFNISVGEKQTTTEQSKESLENYDVKDQNLDYSNRNNHWPPQNNPWDPRKRVRHPLRKYNHSF